jgi:peptidoglycan/xylan/chitin deacetylase (PgdA/CDA1 family)
MKNRPKKDDSAPAPQVVLGFDMETDVGSFTPFYEGLVRGTPRILRALGRRGIPATFFFVGEAARAHPEVVRAVAAAGHEVGAHTLQHETIGDEIFPLPMVRPVLPEECAHRIEVGTRMVEKVLGKKVVSFRAPRLWGSTAMVNALEDLGYVADCTYPLYHFEKRLAPYHPSRRDWTRRGNMRILEIPNFADMTLKSRDPYGRDRDQWPLFRTRGAAALIRHVDRMLAFLARKRVPPVICLYLHPWEFHRMPQGALNFGECAVKPKRFIVENCGAVALREFDRLLGLLEERGAVFRTARDLARRWDGGDF